MMNVIYCYKEKSLMEFTLLSLHFRLVAFHFNLKKKEFIPNVEKC